VIDKLIEKLNEALEDIFQPADDDEILHRIEDMNEDELEEALRELLLQQGNDVQWELAEEAGGDPSDYCVDVIVMNVGNVEDMQQLYMELINGEL